MQLTQEQRLDLRKKVLMGEDLTLDEARAVMESLRTVRPQALAEGETKAKKERKTKAISDDQLNKDLEDLGL